MQAVCDRHGADFLITAPDAMIGVADNVGSGVLPLNGLRHRQGQTSGWFVWAGEGFDEAPDFFKPPVPVGDSLTPTDGDVWFDPSLLEHEV